MKIAELRAKSKEELKELVFSLKKEQFNLRMQRSTGQLEGQGRFKDARRDIARAMTVMNEVPGSVKPKAPKAPKVKKEAAPKTEKAPAKKAAKAKKEKE